MAKRAETVITLKKCLSQQDLRCNKCNNFAMTLLQNRFTYLTQLTYANFRRNFWAPAVIKRVVLL